jgi:hypothetical protein
MRVQSSLLIALLFCVMRVSAWPASFSVSFTGSIPNWGQNLTINATANVHNKSTFYAFYDGQTEVLEQTWFSTDGNFSSCFANERVLEKDSCHARCLRGKDCRKPGSCETCVFEPYFNSFNISKGSCTDGHLFEQGGVENPVQLCWDPSKSQPKYLIDYYYDGFMTHPVLLYTTLWSERQVFISVPNFCSAC